MTAVGDTVVGRMTVVGSGSSGEDDGSRESAKTRITASEVV
jgi:hypothetical protein